MTPSSASPATFLNSHGSSFHSSVVFEIPVWPFFRGHVGRLRFTVSRTKLRVGVGLLGSFLTAGWMSYQGFFFSVLPLGFSFFSCIVSSILLFPICDFCSCRVEAFLLVISRPLHFFEELRDEVVSPLRAPP